MTTASPPPGLPRVFLVRHGETAWSLSGQHTGLTDLPLTAHGEAEARLLREPLRAVGFARVLTSPLQRQADVRPGRATDRRRD